MEYVSFLATSKYFQEERYKFENDKKLGKFAGKCVPNYEKYEKSVYLF